MRSRVAITQPYIPGYRFALWDGVVAALSDEGIAARVFYGGDSAQMAEIKARGDSVDAPWAHRVEAVTFRPSKRLPPFSFRRLPRDWSNAPLLTEMQGTNLNAWASLASHRPYVTMGHGKEYTSDGGRLSVKVESILNRHSAHALSYLPSGRLEVMRRTGLSPERVTSFNNSTDTAALRQALDSTSEVDVEQFRLRHGIPAHARIALFIGSLNEHKRIDVLTDAAKNVLGAGSDWWLVVAGDGPLAADVRALSKVTGRVTMLGQAGPADFAPAAKQARVLLNPGRIGLVAVDALEMRVPILTTDYDRHAPEVEYLTPGTHYFTAGKDAIAFAGAWRSFTGSVEAREWRAPSVSESVRIIAGVLREVALGS